MNQAACHCCGGGCAAAQKRESFVSRVTTLKDDTAGLVHANFGRGMLPAMPGPPEVHLPKAPPAFVVVVLFCYLLRLLDAICRPVWVRWRHTMAVVISGTQRARQHTLQRNSRASRSWVTASRFELNVPSNASKALLQ